MNKGVVAFRIAARPLAIAVWPQTIRLNGIRLLSAPIITKAPPRRSERGTGWRLARTMATSATAASETRASTTVNGGSSASATSAKKNDPPHSTDKATSSSHSASPILRLIAITRGSPLRFARTLRVSAAGGHPDLAPRRR